jgi:myosin heavy subunit
MNYLTNIVKNEDEAENKDEVPIGEQILACNPVLEGFGNSKTLRNDNSSRFGKYIKLFFATEGDEVFGATTKNYLLEKSRVVSVAKDERGYHIFYFILKKMPED